MIKVLSESMFLLFLLLFLFGASACDQAEVSIPKYEEIRISDSLNTWEVNVENLRLRRNPGMKTQTLSTLPKGTIVKDLGFITDFQTISKLRGITFNAPWIKVRTSDNKIGWVFCGALNPTMSNSSALSDDLLTKRITNLLGPILTEKIRIYRKAFIEISDCEHFAELYRNSKLIRNEINEALAKKIDIEDILLAPDLSWLSASFPGYLPQLLAEEKEYYLFKNFGEWYKKALHTKGTNDEDYFEICFLIHPEDSLEYFYPSWFIQTWEEGGHSLLGNGIHLAILSSLDKKIESNQLFKEELIRIKNGVFDDMTNPEMSYWETQKSIITELDSIIKLDFSFWDENEKKQLQHRKLEFLNPDESEIICNQKKGVPEI